MMQKVIGNNRFEISRRILKSGMGLARSCTERACGDCVVPLIVSTFILSAITGVIFGHAEGFFSRLAGQILHGVLVLICFGLVGVAFWDFGWKLGVIDLILTFITGNLGLSVREYLTSTRTF
jgi:uncharacterized membrane protein YdjX (TVP38/TMEM64 family)